MDGVDRHALEAGPANVYYDGVSLGYLGEALVLNISTRVTELKGAQAGDTPLDAIVSGGGISLDVPLAETQVSKMAKGIVNAIANGTLGRLTGDMVNVSNNDTVTIGVKVYTFKTTLTPTEGEVLIGANALESLENLSFAINHTGTPGTDYSVAAVHPLVSAGLVVTKSLAGLAVAHTLQLTPLLTTGADIPTTTSALHLAFDGATITPGAGMRFHNRVGQSIRDLAKEVRVVKIKGGVESTDPEDIFIFPEASPGPSDVKLPFHPTTQRLVPITFIVWPSDETGDWGTVGQV